MSFNLIFIGNLQVDHIIGKQVICAKLFQSSVLLQLQHFLYKHRGSNAFITENNDYNHFVMCKSISRHKVTQTKCRTQELKIVGKNFDVFHGHRTH